MRASLLCFCCCVAILWDGSARAASLRLENPSAVVELDSLVEFVVYGEDFPLGTDGGDFSIYWSPNFEFVDLTIFDPPWDLAAYDASNAAFGYVDYVDVFSFLETPGGGGARFDIATLVLRAIEPGAAYVGLSSNLVGWSLAGESIEIEFGPNAELEVTAAPEPGVAALSALAMSALALVALRQRRSSAV